MINTNTKHTLPVNITETAKKIFPTQQWKAIKELLKGEEREFYVEKINEIVQIYIDTPSSHETDGLEPSEVKVMLHYFNNSFDWWVTEMNIDSKHIFGLVQLGYYPELGYIDWNQLLNHKDTQLDLHWNIESLEYIKNKADSGN